MNKNIGDMTKEELYELCNELLDKDTEYMLIQRRIDKAIEYIKSYLPNYDFDHSNLKKLLEILGDKEWVIGI